MLFQRAQAIGPSTAGLLVLVGAVVTVRQKNRTDRRNLWWSRVQWAADKTFGGTDAEQAAGQAALDSLAKDGAPDVGDLRLLAAIAAVQLDQIASYLAGADLDFDVDEG